MQVTCNPIRSVGVLPQDRVRPPSVPLEMATRSRVRSSPRLALCFVELSNMVAIAKTKSSRVRLAGEPLATLKLSIQRVLYFLQAALAAQLKQDRRRERCS